MPAAGWYPDPAGVPGRYRYWDGSQWSTMFTDDTGRPSEAESAASGPALSEPAKSDPPSRPARRRRLGLIIAVLAVAVSAVVAVAILIGNFRFVANNPPPATTASPSDASPARSPTATPTPSATATPVPLVPCPKGNPNQRAPHPVDGRVYGGNLSFEAQPTFEPAALESRFSFAYDVLQKHFRSARTRRGSPNSPLGSRAERMASFMVHGTRSRALRSALSPAACMAHTFPPEAIFAAKALASMDVVDG